MTAEPLVINFTAGDNQTLVLDYKKPRNEDEAKAFIKEQKVVLKDKVSSQAVETEQFVMPKVGGFQLTRDYQQELIKMGKAFNQPRRSPSPVPPSWLPPAHRSKWPRARPRAIRKP